MHGVYMLTTFSHYAFDIHSNGQGDMRLYEDKKRCGVAFMEAKGDHVFLASVRSTHWCSQGWLVQISIALTDSLPIGKSINIL